MDPEPALPGVVALPSGEEPLPASTISHLAVLRRDEISVLSAATGEIDSNIEPACGVYYHDARYLSLLRLSFGGEPLALLDAFVDGEMMSSTFTNAALPGVPPRTLLVRWRRIISDGVHDTVFISNYGRTDVAFDFQIDFDADFEDLFIVRGFERSRQRPPVAAHAGKSAVHLRFTGTDGHDRCAAISFSPVPSVLETSRARYSVRLEPRGSAEIELRVGVGEDAAEPGFPAALALSHERRAAWLQGLMRFESDDDILDRQVERCLLDIHSLQSQLDGRPYTAAGVPWFDALFGRDSLITGMQLLAFTPTVLRDALLTLAAHQATAFDPAHDAAPGKLPHEVRRSELANSGEVPFGAYYGSVDVTPLFIVAARDYLRWTGDITTIERIAPALVAAARWCEATAAADPRGFVSYSRLSTSGLEQQGWKDSAEGIVGPDGLLATPPIALVEVQAYVAAAFSALADIASRVPLLTMEPYASRARDFLRQFERHFGDDDLGYALCLDGAGQPIRTPSSNTGHVLWAGAASQDRARLVCERLLRTDMFSGWGVRTLGSHVPGYSPLGYHIGSVWPHDNALVLAGFRRYGFADAVELLGQAIVDSALHFPDGHIPELFCGDERSLRSIPTPYPVASRPQAWSAASLPSALTSMLGICPSFSGTLHIVAPILPRDVNWVRLENLRIGGATATVSFRRNGERIGVEVERIDGDAAVVLAHTWSDPPLA